MTRDQISLLLYLETCAVDHAGRVNMARMNADDFRQAEEWAKAWFIQFGRIASKHINRDGARWVTLSDEAWKQAHEHRKARAARMWEKREYATTDEYRRVALTEAEEPA